LTHTDTQWRTGVQAASGLGFAESRTIYIGLDYSPIIKVAESRNIPLSFIFYEKLKAYETTALDVINGRSGKEVCDEQKKESCRALYGDTLEWTCKNCKEINGG